VLLVRSQILCVIFVVKNLIRKKSQITKQIYLIESQKAQAMGFGRLSEIDVVPWESMQSVLCAMSRKYDGERNHDLLEQSVVMARTMWRLDNV